MSTYHVFGRRTVAATWAAYTSHPTEAEAVKAARTLAREGRVSEAIVAQITHDIPALGCTRSFGADEIVQP